ncbi:P-loop NTPase [Candidatus Pseudoruminococcus sp.]|uniref:P-loop NTPase n=1 Tax=Candidatus Pseudoruminococcus sp. TaxID=3101048 RepID=UPI00399B90F2
MSEECTHDCSSCSANCESREKESFLEKLNEYSSVKHVIGIVSGKGGVGKSLVTSTLAVMFNRKGYKTAILDADITGPSIPKAFGIKGRLIGGDKGLEPATSETGIEIISANLILDNESDPIVWRGPMIAGAVKQFWGEAHWDNIDYMFVDMPPGTGDVPLTVFQSIPLDGIIIVTSPQELVSMIVEKAVKMAKMMNIPILGVIENMSYLECPDCGKRLYPFGESKLDEVAKTYDIDILARFPIDSEFAKISDNGRIETVINEPADEAANIIEKKISK